MSPHPADRYDVIIVGARCAGAATALLLARAGLRVLLADRATPGTDTLSTLALMRAGVLQLHRWSLLDRVLAAGTPAITRTTFDYGAAATRVTIKPVAGVSALFAPRRTVLDALLVDAALAAGAHGAFGVTVTGVHRDERGRVRGVTGRDRRLRVFHAFAPVVVGADGLTSTVARAVGAPVTLRGRHTGAMWCTYVTGLPNDGYRWFYRAGAAAGLVPTNDGATCVFAGTNAGRFHVPAGPDRWRSLLDVFTGAAPNAAVELRAVRPVAPVRGWPGTPGLRRRAYGPGWALVGDAGYYTDPIGSHGMTQALRDAELLADAIIAGQDGSESLDLSLARYETVRDELSHGLFGTIDAIVAYDWDQEAVERLLRRLASAMSTEVELLSDKRVGTAAPAAG